jgi:hypothetical protein
MELTWLRKVIHHDGPFVTVYLDTGHNVSDSDHAAKLRWREARNQLSEQGADNTTLGALDEAVGTGSGTPGSRGSRLLVAANGVLLLDRQINHAPDPPRSRWATAPDLLAAIVEVPEQLETVVALVDATGANLRTAQYVNKLDTERRPLHKVRGSVLSYLSMQRRVEKNERASATDIAHALAKNGSPDDRWRRRNSALRLSCVAKSDVGERRAMALVQTSQPHQQKGLQ